MESQELGHTIMNKKWLIVSILVVILLTLIFVISASVKSDNSAVEDISVVSPTVPVAEPSEIPVNSQSQELQKAIAEQSKVDQEYAQWKDNNQQEYPWINKMPFTSDKYYVYFDLDKKVFSATVYPGNEDNVEQIKEMVLNDLKTLKGVEVEKYTFEWTVYRAAPQQ